MSLGEALPQEITRVRGVQDMYKSMRGTPGLWVEPAIAMMEAAIQEGVEASMSGDVVRMFAAYEDLKGFEE